MLSLLRRDPVIGTIDLVKGGILALNAGVMAGFVATLAAGSGSRSPGTTAGILLLAGLMWFSISPFLLFGKARERCHALDLSLPIPARRLWLAHVSALILQGLVFLALTFATLWILLWIFGSAPVGFSLLKQALAGILLPLVAGLVLIVVLMQRVKASLCQIPRSRACTMYSILLLSSGFALIVLLSALPAPAVLVPLGLGVYLSYRTYRSLPPAFAWTPADIRAGIDLPQDARDAAILRLAEAKEWETHSKGGPMRGFPFAWFLIRLICFNPPRNLVGALLFFPLFFLWGLFISGFFAAWLDMDLPQLSYVILSGYLLLSFLPAHMLQLPSVDFLPISRKFLAGFLLIPGFLVLAVGLGAGAVGTTMIERARLQIQLQTSTSSFIPPYSTKAPMVRVPAEYCEISWHGDAPDVASPWGESHPVWKYPLYTGSRIKVYSPFSTPEGSSPRYVAFQISRAIEAIYGVSVPYQEILDRYLGISADQTVVLKDPGRLLADHPEWRSRAGTALTPFLLVVISIVYAIMVSIYFRACRAGVSDARRRALFFAMAIAAIAATAAQVAVMVLRWIRPDVGAAFLKILMLRMVQTIPGGTLTVWILCALVLWGVYELCRRQFQPVEVLPTPTGRTGL